MRLLRYSTLLIITFAATPSSAADLLQTHFAGPSGAPCYARTYDAEHLRRNPRQQVRRIVIDYLPETADGKRNTDSAKFELGFGFQLRKGPGWYTAAAICAMRGDLAGCFLEGDGGQFTLRQNGKGLRIEADRLGIHLEGEKDFAEIGGATSDDNVFLLPVAPTAQCKSSTADVR